MGKSSKLASGWDATEVDRALARELQKRLPDRLFDAHAHLYDTAHLNPRPALLQGHAACGDATLWRTSIGRQVGSRRLHHAMFIPYPSPRGSREAANRFVLDQVRTRPSTRAAILISPQDDPGAVEAMLDENPRVVGLKPYHVFGPGPDTFQCELPDFLPAWAWALADKRRLIILLHMVRDRALADPGNQKHIRRFCRAYPEAKLVLAHSGRGFHAPNTVKGLAAFADLQNVWFDSSAIGESDAPAAILDTFGPRKLMWGTDFPVSQQRGRCVTLGDGFAWVTTDQLQWNDRAFFGHPTVVGLESTRALLNATDRVGLNDEDRLDIFHDNALRLTGMAKESGTRTQDLYRRGKVLIPGGAQLLSKRPEMFAPGQWPAYFREARGCEMWDLDGRHYYDCSIHGIGATLLGFRDPEVTRAVQRRVALGSLCTVNPPEEVELAERLLAIHPWAERARFTRAGGEAMAVAVRIARATTDRSAVAVCGYHGWHDWYLAANLGDDDALRGHLLPGLDPLGVPRELRGTTLPFTYNNKKQLRDIIREHGHRLAAVVMEPCRYHDPEPGFLEFVRNQTRKLGAALIFDEITIGWRLNYGGAHLRLGVEPDMAVFGKTLSNGHLMAAVIGTQDAMEGAHGSFISSSYWTEGVGPVAALATLEKMGRIDVPAHARRVGERVTAAWRKCGERHGLPVKIDNAYPALAHFAFEHELANELKTLYIQSMLDRGIMATTAIYACLAHTDDVVALYASAIDEVFGELAEALRRGDVEKQLRGPPAHTGFRRLL